MVIPTQLLDSMKGCQLVVNMVSFADTHRDSCPVAYWIPRRIGADIVHPDNGVFWGTSEYHSSGTGVDSIVSPTGLQVGVDHHSILS